MTIARRIAPEVPAGGADKNYIPETGPYALTYDVSKTERLLRLHYRSMETNIRDTLQNFTERGW